MQQFDFTPLFRSTVGFERMSRLMDAALRANDGAPGFPPYNVEMTGEDSYRVSMAVAGFGESDLNVTVRENSLSISGRTAEEDEDVTYLHRGVARRAFERRFELDDTIKVTGANLTNGLLNVTLVREVPEARKPRAIEITPGSAAKAIGRERK